MFTKAVSSFSTNDLQKTLAFYKDTLGIDASIQSMGNMEINAGDYRVMIYPKPNHQPATFTVLNFPVTDVEKTVDELIGKGVTFEQYTGDIKTDEKGICRDPRGPMIAWFKDPGGNILSVMQGS